MIVAVAVFELHIEYAQSLKEKRSVVKSLRDRLRHHFEISAAEVALQDVHQRARIGVCFITLDQAQADAKLDRIEEFITTNTDATLVGSVREKLDFDSAVGLG